jgi:hypothetical protein
MLDKVSSYDDYLGNPKIMEQRETIQ